MDKGEERKQDSLRKVGITAPSNPLISLWRGFFKTLQSDLI